MKDTLSHVYAALIRLLPEPMRGDAGSAMLETFDRRLRSLPDGGPLGGRLRFALREFADLFATALRLRLRPRRAAAGGSPPNPRPRGDGAMSTLLTDLRITTRTLLRRPAFLVVASVTLALGIGANAAMFAVVDSVVLRPLPYPDADRLVMVYQTLPSLGWERGPMGLHPFLGLERHSTSFDAVGASTGTERVLLDHGPPRRLVGRRVSGGFFATLGVEPEIGRPLLPADDRPEAERVVVLSHALWTSAFGADAGALGSSVRLGDETFTLVGVMPGDFRGMGSEAFWVPLALDPVDVDLDMSFLTAVARMRDGVELPDARAESDAIMSTELESLPEARDRRAHLEPLHEVVVGAVRQQLLLLLGAVALVLLVACANVAGLTLTRGTRRRRELAVRTALGAGNRTLLRHLLAESVVVATVGGFLGAGLALLLTRAFVAWGPADLPRRAELTVDAGTLVFLVVVTGVCAVAFGLVPALRAARTPPAPTLREGGGQSSGSTRPQAVLAGGQIALATVLLVGAGLLGRSLVRLQSVDPGFVASGVLTAAVPFPAGGADERAAFVRRLEERLAAAPGVSDAAVTWSLPFASGEASTRAMREGESLAPDDRIRVWITPVTPDFFQALRMPLLAGRTFDRALGPDDPPVVVINRALAEALWPGEAPVGKRFLRGGGDDPTLVEVVGVVGDVRTTSLAAEEIQPYAYASFSQSGWADRGYVVLRTEGDPLALVEPLRAAVSELDDELPVDAITTLSDLVGATLARPRFRTALVGGFALLGAVLALVGIYGVMALVVASRRREIGVRIALGAERAHVRGEVVAHGLRIAAVGLAIGLATAVALGRLVESLLFGVGTADAATYLGVVAIVSAGVVLAVLPTALRAGAVEPVEVLQAE